MSEQQISWDLEIDELGTDVAFEQMLLPDGTGDDDPVFKWKNWVAMRNRTLGGCAIKLISEAHRLTALAAAKKVIDGGFAPENFTLSTVLETVQPKIGNRAEIWPVAEEMGTLAFHQIAEACAIDLLRSGRPAKHLLSGIGPFQGYFPSKPPTQMQGLAVPVTVLGVAALAAMAYWASEYSEDVAAVEVEKAWAAARAWSEVKVAQAELAAGRKPQLSDWGKARLRTAAPLTSSWAPYALIGGGVALMGAAVYLGRTALPSHANPCRRMAVQNPKRRKAKRRKANPTRSEFVGEARAAGASQKQADLLWAGYLASHRSRAGRKGGKAGRRHRRNAAPAVPTLPRTVRPGSGTYSARSSARASSKPAKPATKRSPKPAKVAKKSSPKPAKRARPSAPKSPKRAPRAAKRSAVKRAKRSTKRAKR